MKRSFSKVPADVLGGYIMLSETVLAMIPAPLHHEGFVEVHLGSWNDEVALVTGSGVKLELIGEPKYIEELRPDSNKK